MKKYTIGLITGALLAVSAMMFIGAQSGSELGRYQFSTAISAGELRSNVYETIIDTQTGVIQRYKTPASKYYKK